MVFICMTSKKKLPEGAFLQAVVLNCFTKEGAVPAFNHQICNGRLSVAARAASLTASA